MMKDEKRLVVGFADYLVRNNRTLVKDLKKLLAKYDTPFIEIMGAADRWCRDYMPFQRHDGKFVAYKYSPDYLVNQEKYITDINNLSIIEFKGQMVSSILDLKDYLSGNIINTELKIDGGNLISCRDKTGNPYILMTDKVFIENRHLDEEQVIEELKLKFDADFIFLPWDRSEPFGHTDGMVRSIDDGKLLLGNYKEDNPMIYDAIMEKVGDLFDIYELSFGKDVSENSWCHINFLPLENAIIVPAIGEKSDMIACEQIEEFTGKKCELIDMGKIPSWGGALNCITWDFHSF